MESEKRREYIKEMLNNNVKPKKGQEIANKLGVTRQVIVKDIAILRATGMNIIATPQGYVIPKPHTNAIEKIVAVYHERKDIDEEMQCIVKYGGTIKDVIVEHPVYGEIKAMIMAKTPYDVQKFIKNLNNNKAEPLLALTKGVHLHTIEVDNIENMKKIINELSNKGFIIK
ncbi:transcription repressor NadR [Clostridium massiliodielmoense]|uniref:transcription repressor NadR n=1 Tax=Clostridium massiliodielmoense TaxID=1776385 RepID=UPI0004D63855|nr:transcription repressor NadR [Clostridium massiliodielmoense]KEH95646.1 transcriptional regulator [Clostridium botulinum C/D str. BKT12695]